MTFSKELVIEWTITALLLVGVALTSFNIYPANLWVLLIGNLGWIYLGYYWRKWSLFIVQSIITAIYLVGIINLYY
jgi:hypothetical protein